MTTTYDIIMAAVATPEEPVKTSRNLSSEAAAVTRADSAEDIAALRMVQALLETLRKAEQQGIPAKMAADTYKAQLKAWSALQDAKAMLLARGVGGTATENAAEAAASASVIGSKLRAASEDLNKSYARAEQMRATTIERAALGGEAFTGDKNQQSAVWQAWIASTDPEAPWLNHGFNQMVATYGDPRAVISTLDDIAQRDQLNGKLNGITDASKKLDDENAARFKIVDDIGGAGHGGLEAMDAALASVRLLEEQFAAELPAMGAAGDAAAEAVRIDNAAIGRIKEDLTKAEALAFPAQPVDDTLTREQIAATVMSPRFRRFAQQHGWNDLGKVVDGVYYPGKDDMRVIRAGLRSYQGEPVRGPLFRDGTFEREPIEIQTADGMVTGTRAPLRVDDPDGDVIRLRLTQADAKATGADREHLYRKNADGTYTELGVADGVPQTPTKDVEPHTGDEPDLPEVPDEPGEVADLGVDEAPAKPSAGTATAPATGKAPTTEGTAGAASTTTATGAKPTDEEADAEELKKSQARRGVGPTLPEVPADPLAADRSQMVADLVAEKREKAKAAEAPPTKETKKGDPSVWDPIMAEQEQHNALADELEKQRAAKGRQETDDFARSHARAKGAVIHDEARAKLNAPPVVAEPDAKPIVFGVDEANPPEDASATPSEGDIADELQALRKQKKAGRQPQAP